MTTSSRFAGIDFSEQPVIEATPHLMATLGGGFRCTRNEFGSYFKNGRLAREMDTHMCKCWLIQDQSYLAGYITLLTDKLVLEEQKLVNEGVKYRTFPAIKIGLLAADKRAKGAGKRLVEWAMDYIATDLARKIGIRFLTVDAFYDADKTPPYDISGFYEHLGFAFVNPDEDLPPVNSYRTMYMDLKPLIDAVNTPQGTLPPECI